MANNILLTNFDYIYDGILSTEVFIEPAVRAPMITDLFTVRTGIKYKEQLNISQQLGKILKGGQGCNQQVTGDPVNAFNRTLETCLMEVYLEQCSDVFEATIMGELSNNGISRYNLTGTEIGTLIETLFVEALQRELFRIFSFGDKTNGPNDYYNYCDGLWTRLFDGAASYEVTEINNNITTLSGSDAKGYFKALHEGAEIVLKQLPVNQRKFYVTGNVWEALMGYYEDNANSGGFVGREEDGVMRLRYRGVDIIPYYAWDDWIETDNLGNNTRILYTTPMNHVIGVEQASSQGQWEFWYDRDSRKNKVDASMKMGYNYVHGKLQAISYGNV